VVEEQLETEDNEDVYVLSKVADVLHSLFVTYKADFFPMFDTLVGHFVRMLGPERPWSDRQWSLCVFDDVIEFGGPACIKYQEHFLGPILTSVQDKQPEVRQAAVYGCGILGQCGGETFAGEWTIDSPLVARFRRGSVFRSGHPLPLKKRTF